MDFYHSCDTKPFCDHHESHSLSTKTPSSTVKDLKPPSYNILEVPNSKAIVLALKTLQEKISRLEIEKTKAHSHLTCLSVENAEHKKALSDKEKSEAAQHEAIRQKNDVITQLSSAQQRCTLLEKQLDYMKKMVQNTEMEKNTMIKQQALLAQGNVQDKLEKLDFLEEECRKLVATQQGAEEKIHQLEEKLLAEKQQRKLMEDKAVQLESGLEVNRIFLSVAAQNATQRKVKKKSTGTSHSVSANVQSVMHMIKHQSQSPRPSQKRLKSAGHKPVRFVAACRTAACSVSTTGDSLSDLLFALQGELEQMNFEHDELLKQINETKDTDIREDLEREMDCLVKQMETKSDQILKLKRHQQNVIRLKKAARSMKKLSCNARSAIKAESGKTAAPATPCKQETSARSTPTPRSSAALQLLKNVQKIQTSLKKDDIMWEK